MTSRILAALCLFVGADVCIAEQPRLDGHGFPLPEGAIARLGDLRHAQRGYIRGIAISSDGRVVATSGSPGRGEFRYGEFETDSINLFDAEKGRLTREIPIGVEANPLGFTKNGKLLAVGYHVGFALIEVATGKPWWPADAPERPRHGNRVHFLENDRWMITAIEGSHGDVEVWDLAKGTRERSWSIARLKGSPQRHAIESLKLEGFEIRIVLSPTGSTMAALVQFLDKGDNRPSRAEVHVFRTLTGERMGEPQKLASYIHDIALLDEGETALLETCFKGVDRFGRDDIGGNIAIDMKTGKERFRIHHDVGRHPTETSLTPHPLEGVRLHRVAPDGKSFYAYGHKEGYLRRDTATGKALGGDLQGNSVSGRRIFAFTPDPKKTLVADNARWFWDDLDFKPLTPPTENPSPYPGVVYLSDTRIRYASGPGKYRIWDLKEGKAVETGAYPPAPKFHAEPNMFEWRHPKSYDGSRRLVVANYQQRLVVRDLVADKELCRLEGVTAGADQRHWPIMSDDGGRILVPFASGNDLLVCWYDSRTGRKQGSYRVPSSEVFPDQFPFAPYGDLSRPAASWFSDDGSVFSYITPDSRLTLVDTATGKALYTLGISVPLAKQPARQEPEPPAVGSRPGPRPMFMPATYQPRTPAWSYWRTTTLIAAYRHAEDADGQQIGKEYLLFDSQTGAMLRRFKLSGGYVRKFSPDGRFAFVSNGWDGVSVCETATGLLRGTIHTDAGAGFSSAIAPDGKTMATGGADTTVLVWDLNRPLGGGPALAPADALGGTPNVYFRMLESLDPGTAEPALWALVRAPEKTLNMLQESLKPTEKPEANLFEESRLPNRTLRNIRALEVLERIGTAEAKKLVEALAGGHAESLVTREAKLVLSRWP